MDYLYTGILLIHVSLYLTLNGLHVQLHAISRCAGDTCESGVGVYPHCTECNKYIYCVFGYAVERTCPENLVFDIDYGICNLPKHAKCWNNKSSSPGRIGTERIFYKPSNNLLKRDQALTVNDLKSELEVTMKTDDPPEEVTIKPDDPPKDNTMNTDDPPEDATMNTDDPPEEWNRQYSINPDFPQNQDPAESNTDDPPQDATMNTDDPPEDATMNTDDPPQDATMNTDDPPEDATMNTDDPPQDATINTDDPPQDATINTDDPPKDATMNTNNDDPPKDATMNTNNDDPAEEWNRQYSINPDFPQNQDPAESNTASKTYNQQPLETSNDVRVRVPCVKNCNGMPQGTYQSCDGCTKYVSCMWGMKLDNTCFSGLFWDDISKNCVTHSTTC